MNDVSWRLVAPRGVSWRLETLIEADELDGDILCFFVFLLVFFLNIFG